MLIRIWNWIKKLFAHKPGPETVPDGARIPKPRAVPSLTGKQSCPRCGRKDVRLCNWKGFEFCISCVNDLTPKKTEEPKNPLHRHGDLTRKSKGHGAKRQGIRV